MLSLWFLFLSGPILPRRNFIETTPSSLFIGNFFGGGGPSKQTNFNEVSSRKLGSSDIEVSGIALGTQRWVSDDFNAPNEEECFRLMDTAYEAGVRTIDTAEQYPIPSSPQNPEGKAEEVIGKWMKSRAIDRKSMTIISKITGATNISPRSIEKDLDGSLLRLGTDYLDVYMLHWPQRYQPQSNWGQSLQYRREGEYRRRCSFHELVATMDKMVKKGKLRGWGTCNDSAYGLTKMAVIADDLGAVGPCAFQGDYSLLDRKSDENGVLEACSPYNENIGFMGYNILAGGMLTGKYTNRNLSGGGLRGRMDTKGWGGTLYRYQSDAAKRAIDEYSKLAKENGMGLGELSVRWALQRSGVSTLLIGHSNVEQLKEQLAWTNKGAALTEDLLWDIDRVHMKHRNPIWSNENVPRDWFGTGLIGEPIP